jgi:hypothetical protein
MLRLATMPRKQQPGAPSFAHLRRVGCTISLEGDEATILCLKLPKPSVIPSETQRNGRACLREVEWRSTVCAVSNHAAPRDHAAKTTAPQTRNFLPGAPSLWA